MKFKISKGTQLFDEIQKVRKEMVDAIDAALEVMKEVGADKVYTRRNPYILDGGISGFGFKEKPKGWVLAWTGSKGVYMPRKSKENAALLTKMGNLPIVKKSALTDLLKFKEQTFFKNGKSIWTTCPGVAWKDDYILIEMDDEVTYSPVKDMIEITTSEFKLLNSEQKVQVSDTTTA